MGELARAVSGLVRTQVRLPRYFTREQVERILAHCENLREKVLILFLWRTGVRAEEALKTRWVDVDFHGKRVRVVTLKKSRKKTKGRKPVKERERVIPIDDALLSELLLWREETRRQAERSKSVKRREKLLEYVFPFGYSRLYQLVRKVALRAGFDAERAHPHTFRHSFAVHLLKEGVPITVVQQLLGHSSVENTMVYTAIVAQEAVEFLRKVRW
jgi:integrase